MAIGRPPMSGAQRVALFWSQVEKTDTCWLWTGGCSQNGYGAFKDTLGKQWKAHRFAYVLEYGAIPDGGFICHRCDNPRCVNPAHLYLGDAFTNNRDTVIRNRRAPQKGHCRKGHPFTAENTLPCNGGKARRCRICTYATNNASYARSVGPRRKAMRHTA